VTPPAFAPATGMGGERDDVTRGVQAALATAVSAVRGRAGFVLDEYLAGLTEADRRAAAVTAHLPPAPDRLSSRTTSPSR
jgi:hypothetical protein